MTAHPGRRAAPLALPAMGAWAAAAGCTRLSPFDALRVAGVGVVVLAACLRGRPALAALAAGVLAGALTAAWHVRGLERGIVPSLARRHAQVDVVAVLVRDPVAVAVGAGSGLLLVDATVQRVWVHGSGWHGAHSPVLVLAHDPSWQRLLPGQQVDVSGRLGPPRSGDDVSAVLAARAPPMPLGRPPWWQRAAGRVRDALRRACAGLPSDERGLLPGLVDGDTSATPASLQLDMRLTGLTHLEAVSGENVSVVLSVTIALAAAAGLRRRSRVVVSAVALAGFVVLARPSPSVLRAAVMGAVVLLATATGRRAAALPALSAAVLLLVVVNPFLARSLGFVLSVLATAALVTVAPRWTVLLSRRLPAPVAAAVAVPAAAQLACTPVLVAAFGRLTPYAVPANLLAAAAVAPATIAGLVVALVATAAPAAAAPIAWLAAVPTAVIAAVAHGFAGLPGAGLRWSTTTAALTVAGAVLLGSVVLIRRWRVTSWADGQGDVDRR